MAKSGWAWPILTPGSGYIRQLQVKHCLAPNSHTFNTTPAYKNLPDKAWPAQTVVTEQLRQLIPGEWLAVCACLPVCGRGQACVPRLQPALMSFCPTRSRRPWLLLPSGFTSSVRDFTSSGRGGVLTAPWAAVGTWRRAKAALPKSGDSWQKQCMRGFLTCLPPIRLMQILYVTPLCLNIYKAKMSRNKLFLPPAPSPYQHGHSLWSWVSQSTGPALSPSFERSRG